MEKRKTWMSWSSGKDSAWALHQLRLGDDYEVTALFTTTNQEFERVAMHGVRNEVLRKQAAAVGLPLIELPLPFPCTNEDYERIMGEFVSRAQAERVECMAFGDLYLEDVRDYRIKNMEGSGIEPVFPIWGKNTSELADEMLAAGVKTILSVVNPEQVPAELAGQYWNHELIGKLPVGVDPCGENGEFHSCVVDGPMFDRPIPVAIGESVLRDGFMFADIELV
ncbi:adenine nucleotide alpha hydrolase [Persicirhabdus sediminis]|uniref:Adenine nucleotide alpha hydrolase n=1 Tax=Persicirhabdus sediminis TaxID=454144 RepID=A0A8J7SKD2_9BACT|nr:adenine nucleotide alpha hydrolase [Persicirhabdus sediminis]MBK1790705.1 adenine nucleotide alpha hydrolase [Persicirhabdus sediminis]